MMMMVNNGLLLRRLGWVTLRWAHGAVIVEGPEETAVEANEEVMRCVQETCPVPTEEMISQRWVTVWIRDPAD